MLKKIKKLDIEIDRRLYSSYIEALAAQCDFDLATEAIDKMEAEIGLAPTSTT
jgi:pentatricopeptide repeat protein